MDLLDVYSVDEFVIDQEELKKLTDWFRGNGHSLPPAIYKTIEKLIHKELYRDFLILR